MGKRKVTILEPAVEEVAQIALFIESEGLPKLLRNSSMKLSPFLLLSQMNALFIDRANIQRGRH
jgi:hypothetical protein